MSRAHGRLEARFERRGGGTVLAGLRCEPPLQAQRALWPDGRGGPADLIVAMLGPGLMGGDLSQVAVAVGPGGYARVRGQSATRVLAARDGHPARSEARLVVDAGALLAWLPLPTILQADAEYVQETAVEVADGGAAVLVDVVVPGRLARGERFAFASFDARLTVHNRDGHLLAAERQRLRRSDHPGRPGLFREPDVVLGSLFVLAPGRSLAALAAELSPTVHLTELPNGAGLLARALGPSAQVVLARLAVALEQACAWLAPTGRAARSDDVTCGREIRFGGLTATRSLDRGRSPG